jgi:hypothetical protein
MYVCRALRTMASSWAVQGGFACGLSGEGLGVTVAGVPLPAAGLAAASAFRGLPFVFGVGSAATMGLAASRGFCGSSAGNPLAAEAKIEFKDEREAEAGAEGAPSCVFSDDCCT